MYVQLMRIFVQCQYQDSRHCLLVGLSHIFCSFALILLLAWKSERLSFAWDGIVKVVGGGGVLHMISSVPGLLALLAV